MIELRFKEQYRIVPIAIGTTPIPGTFYRSYIPNQGENVSFYQIKIVTDLDIILTSIPIILI